MLKHWLKAARLRTLPLSLSGIILGSFLAIYKQAFRWEVCVLALLTTIAFQVLSNFANDYGDGVKGTDNENRIGPERALQSGKITPKQMLNAIYMNVVVALILAIGLIYVSFGNEHFLLSLLFFFLCLASIGAAMKYTMGKNAYGYSGLGDVFVFVFFGLLSVMGSEFLYTQQFDLMSILPAISIGLFSVAVLNLNNMRDRASDILANKNTLVVKIGTEKAKKYHYVVLLVGMLSAILYSGLIVQEGIQLIYLISFIPLFKNIQTVRNTKKAVLLDGELKKVALTTFVFSILYGITFLF